MFNLGEIKIKFYRFDNLKKGNKRSRITTCAILDKYNNVLLSLGRSKYNEGDIKLNNPFNKGYGRRLALARALNDLRRKNLFGKEFYELIWKEYYKRVSRNEQLQMKGTKNG